MIHKGRPTHGLSCPSLSFKPPRLKGLSADLIASHYDNNYGGAVQRLDAIRGEFAGSTPRPRRAFVSMG